MKVKIINGITCGLLKLKPLESGFCGFVDGDASEKIIAASPSLNLPVLIIPEREDIDKLAKQKFPDDTATSNTIREIWKEGFRAHAATHPYSESDLRKAFGYQRKMANLMRNGESFEEFLSSLRPQGIWAELSETFSDTGDDDPLTGNHILKREYYFKTNGKELIVIEWE